MERRDGIIAQAETSIRVTLPPEVRLALVVLEQAKTDLEQGNETDFADAARWVLLNDEGIMSLQYYCDCLHLDVNTVRHYMKRCISPSRLPEALAAL